MVFKISLEGIAQQCAELIEGRLWCCSRAHDCKKCAVAEDCRKIFDEHAVHGTLDPVRTEQLLDQFQELIRRNKVTVGY